VWQPSERYPDPAIEVFDGAFAKYQEKLASVERLGTGYRWAEGPVWFGDGRYLVWSDIPNNRMMRWSEESGEIGVFRSPSNFANGNTRDRAGRLVTCEHGGRRVTRTEYDGAITVLADSFEGKPLNSPNDVVVSSDGSIWFSDPAYGIRGYYEGYQARRELPCAVYRIDAGTGDLALVADDLTAPNGLAFSPDESVLYVVDSGASPSSIHAYEVADGGRALTNRRLLIDADEGTPDGFRVDVDGNLWCGWGMGPGLDGVRVFTPDGRLIGGISLPERCANLVFGGRYRNRLFMAAAHSVYSLYVNAQGAV